MPDHMNGYERVEEIIKAHECDNRIMVSSAYGDGGLDPLFGRLQRAAVNQVEDGTATLSRYGIWANTVRDNLREALLRYDSGETQEATRLIRRSIDALSAFADIQAVCDQMRDGVSR